MCGGHFHDVGIVAGARAMQRTVEQATIAQAGRPPNSSITRW
jgi:hypothetical protein